MDGTLAARSIRLLTDPTRLRILGLIQESPDGRALVGRLATELGLRQPTVSHHVKALLDDELWLLVIPLARLAIVLAVVSGARVLPVYATLV